MRSLPSLLLKVGPIYLHTWNRIDSKKGSSASIETSSVYRKTYRWMDLYLYRGSEPGGLDRFIPRIYGYACEVLRVQNPYSKCLLKQELPGLG